MWVKHLFHSSRMHKAVLFLHLSRHKVCHSIYEVLPLPAVFVPTLRILSFFHIHRGYCSIPDIWLCLLHAHSIPHHNRNNASFPACMPVPLSSDILHSNSPLSLCPNKDYPLSRKSLFTFQTFYNIRLMVVFPEFFYPCKFSQIFHITVILLHPWQYTVGFSSTVVSMKIIVFLLTIQRTVSNIKCDVTTSVIIRCPPD